MGIVVITIPGEGKRAFARALHEKTGGNVELVIVQKVKQPRIFKRLKVVYSRRGFFETVKDAWYALMLRFNKNSRRVLDYFRHHTPLASTIEEPKMIEVDSVNSDKVHALLKNISPHLLVVWGCTILKPHILATAPKVVNLHLGMCPHYRGAIANQYAVMNGDYHKVGATIHYVTEKMDAGRILAVLAADPSRSPRDVFLDLNNRAQDTYIDIAVRLHNGETILGEAQDLTVGKNVLLKDWTHAMRYKLAREMLRWERGLIRPHTRMSVETPYTNLASVPVEIKIEEHEILGN